MAAFRCVPFKGTLTFACLWLIADRRLALVVTCNAPHGVDGALDGQLLELLHGMEWWLLLALLRLSMALSLSVFSRLTLTSRFFDMALKKWQMTIPVQVIWRVVRSSFGFFCVIGDFCDCRFWLFSENSILFIQEHVSHGVLSGLLSCDVSWNMLVCDKTYPFIVRD